MKEPLTRARAEILALEGLAWLAGQPDAIAGFLTISGLKASDLRVAVGDPELQTAVLDFLLANDALLLDFCHSASREPQQIHAARYRISEEGS